MEIDLIKLRTRSSDAGHISFEIIIPKRAQRGLRCLEEKRKHKPRRRVALMMQSTTPEKTAEILVLAFTILGIIISFYIYLKGPKITRSVICETFCNHPEVLLLISILIMTLILGWLVAIVTGILTQLPVTQYSQMMVAIGLLLTALTLAYTTCPYYCPKQPLQCPNARPERPSSQTDKNTPSTRLENK